MAYNSSKKEYLVDTTSKGVSSSTAASLKKIAESAGIKTSGMSTSQLAKAIKAQSNATGNGSNNLYGDTIGDATLKNFGYQVVNGEIVALPSGAYTTSSGLSTNSGANMSESVSKALSFLEGKSAAAKYDTSNPFGFITGYDDILGKLNDATNKSYDIKTKEALLGLNKAENTSYANTQNAMSELRKSLAGSASNGANVGAANATALQALLGLGATNKESVTEALQGVQQIAGERQAALAQNAASAIDTSNSAKNMQGTIANEKYNADSTVVAEALAALGALMGTADTNATNERMNIATNKANESIAKTQADAQKAAASTSSSSSSKKTTTTKKKTTTTKKKNTTKK